MTITADRTEVKQQPIQKAERLSDLPAGPIRDHFEWVTRMCRGDVTNDSRVIFEGCERENHHLTGIAIIDANRWVVRVAVDGGRTAFFPIINGMHHSSPFGVGGGGLGTKKAAFEFIASVPPTNPTTPEEVDASAAAADLDSIDREALVGYVVAHDAQIGPRVGDFVVYGDGTALRFTYDHDEAGLQTTSANGIGGGGSFHFGGGLMSSDVGCNYSGSLDPCVRRETLTETGEKRLGNVWIWHHRRPAAHNGVTVAIPFRVFATTLDRPRYARG